MSFPTVEYRSEYIYKVIDCNNYDGDSINIIAERVFDFGFGKKIIGQEPIKVRLFGIDTPELRSGSEDHKAAGRLAADLVQAWLDEGFESSDKDADYPCFILFESIEYKKGKYGRALGDFIDIRDGCRLSDYILKERLGVKYYGQSKADIQHEHDANILYLKQTGLI